MIKDQMRIEIRSKMNSFIEAIRNEIARIDKLTLKRRRKLTTADLMRFLIEYIDSAKPYMGNSYENVNNQFKIRKEFNVSKTTLINKLNSLPSKLLFGLCKVATDHIFNGEPQNLISDGTQLHLEQRFKEYEFPLTQNKKSCKMYINAITDSKTGIPICYVPEKHSNETR